MKVNVKLVKTSEKELEQYVAEAVKKLEKYGYAADFTMTSSKREYGRAVRNGSKNLYTDVFELSGGEVVYFVFDFDKNHLSK